MTDSAAAAWPRGATPHPRSGAVAGRSYPTSEVRGGGWEELPHARGQGRWPRGATPRPRSSGCVGTGGPRGASPCSRSGGAVVRRYTEIPLIQGKEQWLRFAGAAMKSYPTSRVKETQVRG